MSIDTILGLPVGSPRRRDDARLVPLLLVAAGCPTVEGRLTCNGSAMVKDSSSRENARGRSQKRIHDNKHRGTGDSHLDLVAESEEVEKTEETKRKCTRKDDTTGTDCRRIRTLACAEERRKHTLLGQKQLRTSATRRLCWQLRKPRRQSRLLNRSAKRWHGRLLGPKQRRPSTARRRAWRVRRHRRRFPTLACTNARRQGRVLG